MNSLIPFKRYKYLDIGKDFETTYMFEQRYKYTVSFWTKEEKKIRKEAITKYFGGIYSDWCNKFL